MSINPTSDLVLNVSLAADPVLAANALRKLGPGSNEFQTAMSNAETPTSRGSTKSHIPGYGVLAYNRASNQRALEIGQFESQAFSKLEAFLLQTMIQSMLPSGDKSVFGRGTAGSVWRSMLAEHIANRVTETGGVGVAAGLRSSTAQIIPLDNFIGVSWSDAKGVKNGKI